MEMMKTFGKTVLTILCVLVLSSSFAQEASKPEKLFAQLRSSFEGVEDGTEYQLYALKSKDFWWIWISTGYKMEQIAVYDVKKKEQVLFNSSEFLDHLGTYAMLNDYASFKNEAAEVKDLKLFGYYKLSRKGENRFKRAIQVAHPMYGKRKFDIQKMVYDIEQREKKQKKLDDEHEKEVDEDKNKNKKLQPEVKYSVGKDGTNISVDSGKDDVLSDAKETKDDVENTMDNVNDAAGAVEDVPEAIKSLKKAGNLKIDVK